MLANFVVDLIIWRWLARKQMHWFRTIHKPFKHHSLDNYNGVGFRVVLQPLICEFIASIGTLNGCSTRTFWQIWRWIIRFGCILACGQTDCKAQNGNNQNHFIHCAHHDCQFYLFLYFFFVIKQLISEHKVNRSAEQTGMLVLWSICMVFIKHQHPNSHAQMICKCQIWFANVLIHISIESRHHIDAN